MTITHLKNNDVNKCEKKNRCTKELDTMKLKHTLMKIGIKPCNIGTRFIIEELKFYFENNSIELADKLYEVYQISADIHNLPISRVQWNIQYALEKITNYGDKEKIEEIFFWYDPAYNISPKNFFESMVHYMNVHEEDFTLK